MARFAEPMSRLIDELRKLPGIGTKSAQRLAFHVLRGTDADARSLADALLELRAKLHLCSICACISRACNIISFILPRSERFIRSCQFSVVS